MHVFSLQFERILIEKMNETVIDVYAGIQDFTIEGLMWNAVMIQVYY